MSAESSPHPPDVQPWITLPEFLRLLKTDPEFIRKTRANLEAALAIPLSPDTEQMHANARTMLQTLKHHEALTQAEKRMLEAGAILKEPIADWDETTPRRLNALVEESMDHLLDVQEPERTALMKTAMGLQEMMRRIPETGERR